MAFSGSMRESLAYLNGDFVPLRKAKVSVLDRGFLFGDGVYEVVPVYRGKPFLFDRHLDRLEQSLEAIGIEPPLSREAWHEIVSSLIETEEDRALYLQITRGCDPFRDHLGDGQKPTIVAFTQPMPPRRQTPLKAITCDDIRWRWCFIKTTSLLANVLLKRQAKAEGADEAILIRDGLVTEGAASNVFIVHEGEILTPPKGPHLLPGVTRDLLLEIGREAGLPLSERPIPVERLRQAEEIWLTSSTRELVPVTLLDGRPVGNGETGPCFRRCMELLQQFKVRALQG